MSAAEALKAARAAGIELELEGDDLVLGSGPNSLLRLFSTSCRATRPGSCGCCGRVATAGLPRTGRLSSTSAPALSNMMVVSPVSMPRCLRSRTASIIGWRCIHRSQASMDTAFAVALPSLIRSKASVVVTCVGGTTGRLHASCASDWKNLRRWNARTALMWLLDSSKRAVN